MGCDKNRTPYGVAPEPSNERGVRCSVFYIFTMMVKIEKTGSKFEKSLFRGKIFENMVNQINFSKNYPKLSLKTNYFLRKSPQLPHSKT
jgi:hypothetical protein